MVVDTSAIFAIIAQEPDSARCRNAMINATSLAICATTALEARIVLKSRKGFDAVREFNSMLSGAGS